MATTIKLNRDHVRQSLSREIEIGSDWSREGDRKRFLYMPHGQEFQVMRGITVTHWGGWSDLDALLDEYNDM